MATRWTDADLCELTESALRTAIDRSTQVPGLAEACRYAALGGGKRIRPLILFRACEACGGAIEAAVPAACAVELVHAFSLVHDDLPAIDDDDVRRGRPTLHRAFPESLAILAGDALFAMGLAQAAASPVAGAEAARELMQASLAMIDGQVLDTMPPLRPDASPAELVRLIHGCKTGALLAASAKMGAMVAGADAGSLAAVAGWGEAVGLMFQVVDDWIDATQHASHAGKATGKDAAQGKLTWVTALGQGAARSQVDRLRELALQRLQPLGPAGEDLRRMTAQLAERTA